MSQKVDVVVVVIYVVVGWIDQAGPIFFFVNIIVCSPACLFQPKKNVSVSCQVSQLNEMDIFKVLGNAHSVLSTELISKKGMIQLAVANLDIASAHIKIRNVNVIETGNYPEMQL